jgi:hypothetical protein
MAFHKAQKRLDFQGRTPPTCPHIGFARLKRITYGGHINQRSIKSYNTTSAVYNEWEISNLYVECDVLWLLFLLHSSRFLLQFVLQAVRKHVQGILVVHAYISALLMTMCIGTNIKYR